MGIDNLVSGLVFYGKVEEFDDVWRSGGLVLGCEELPFEVVCDEGFEMINFWGWIGFEDSLMVEDDEWWVNIMSVILWHFLEECEFSTIWDIPYCSPLRISIHTIVTEYISIYHFLRRYSLLFVLDVIAHEAVNIS